MKPVLMVSYAFSNPVGGSGTVMRNLLKWMDPSEYVIATTSFNKNNPPFPEAYCYSVMRRINWSYRLDYFLRVAQINSAAKKIANIAVRHRVGGLLAIYPDLHLTAATHRAHKATGIPLAVYLHDTISDSNIGTSAEKLARETQELIFRDSKVIMTMSQGLSDLLKQNYGINSIPIIHPYNEVIPDLFTEHRPLTLPVKIFFGGLVYNINEKALARLITAFLNFDIHLKLNSPPSKWLDSQIKKNEYKLSAGWAVNREEYLKGLPDHDIFIVALNWPDECNVHINELSTIFPTKIPDYLAAGRPILIHCPENYFLAKFCTEHGCGLVISDRSKSALKVGIEKLMNDASLRSELSSAALKTAKMFAGEKVFRAFKVALVKLVS